MPVRKFLASLLIAVGSAHAFAGTGDGKSAPAPIIQDPLAKGVTEIEVLGSYMHSPITTGGAKRPEFDYAGGDIRWGIVLTPMMFENSPLFRGNVEFLVDGFGDGVTKGPGNYLVGGALLFRYNFIHSPASKIIPYFQLGGGGLHSDAAEVPSQRIVGGNFEFDLEAELGARVLLNDRWSLIVEGAFQHISNADTAARNVGVNALGGRVGLGWIY